MLSYICYTFLYHLSTDIFFFFRETRVFLQLNFFTLILFYFHLLSIPFAAFFLQTHILSTSIPLSHRLPSCFILTTLLNDSSQPRMSLDFLYSLQNVRMLPHSPPSHQHHLQHITILFNLHEHLTTL